MFALMEVIFIHLRSNIFFKALNLSASLSFPNFVCVALVYNYKFLEVGIRVR